MIRKRAILAVAFSIVSHSVAADTWVMNNQGRGQIVLTDRKCKESNSLFYAYTYTEKLFLEGCWELMDGKVHVVWDKKNRRVYELNDFVPDHIDTKKNIDTQIPKRPL